ncbi:MAG TPA: response regulator [Gammaproteobacteria bacterium]|nr:response regulator [Gammaproteobacteria bacterium]
MKKPLILIVEDEAAILEMLQLSLNMAGFATTTASSTKAAEEKNAARIPDLILLDWMLPGQSGVDYIKKLRNDPTTMHIPIILLTAKAEEENKIKGLDAGADDYITKPFSPRELLSRIKTVLRRGPLVSTEGIITIKDLVLNTHTRSVSIGEKSLELSPIIYDLLYFFIRHQNRVYTREQLLQHVWGGDKDINDRTVDVQIRRLRKVLKNYGYDHYIHTIYGTGYLFSEDNE